MVETIYSKYWNAARARKLFEEYQRLARLVDDLDIRFWKRFILRDYARSHSIEDDLAEDNLREEYKSCTSDLMKLHGKVTSALETVTSPTDRAMITDFYLRDMSMGEMMEKWQLKEPEIYSMIQRGLMEAKLPDEE